MPAIILADSGWTGSLEMSSFQGLSGGKTCKAARILSASGVLNITGLVISGIFGLSPPPSLVASWQYHPARTAVTTSGENHFMEGGLTVVIGMRASVGQNRTTWRPPWDHLV